MKKFWKVLFISLGSLVGLVLIVICIALWLVFTPARITPIVQKQADKFLLCETGIGRVELTFFSTFPHFGLEAHDVSLRNPVAGSPSDTLLAVSKVRASIDLKAFLRKDQIIVSDILLSNGSINVYTDSLGNSNYDIFPSVSEESAVGDDESRFSYFDIKDIALDNISLAYIDEQSGMKASVWPLSGKVRGTVNGGDIDGEVALKPLNAAFELEDPGSAVVAKIDGLSPVIQATIKDGAAKASVSTGTFNASVEYGGEKYLDNTAVMLETEVDADLERKRFNFKSLSVSLNDLALSLSGSVLSDTVDHSLTTDIAYKFTSWPLSDIIALVPASYSSYLDGIDVASGRLSSNGTIKGVYKDSTSMPLMQLNLTVEDGALGYDQMLPFPLHDINADLFVSTDLHDDANSFVRINALAARTPKSSIATSGKIYRLFSDMHVDLATELNLDLAEFQPMVPDSIALTMGGNASGRLTTVLSLGQVEKMELEKMKIGAALNLKNIDVVYDTVALQSDNLSLELRMPNEGRRSGKMKFAAITLSSDNLSAGMGEGMNVSVRNAGVSLTTSDVRDTTRLPALLCDFSFGHIAGRADTISFDVEKPSGRLSLAAQRRSAGKPRFHMEFDSGELAAAMGTDQYSVEKVNLRAEVTYDPGQEQFFMKWMPNGSVDIRSANISMKSIGMPVAIPLVTMDFTPFDFEIEHASVSMGDTDFSLQGKLSNILPYFQGDSILKGEFSFLSKFTDANMLMELTSGVGYDEEEDVVNDATSAEGGFSGPYMVPKGMDIVLHADINEARFSEAQLLDVKGDIIVKDGVLILDDLSFASPGDMDLTAYYRTERKNRLFVGLNFHLTNVEIAELLKMIPAVDEVMPMLRSFSGKGEFHIAAQTYLDSLYNVKMSTLRGAASISGNDLVLMDSDTFNEVVKEFKLAKKLMAHPEKGITIDSLSAEFTVFRNEVDVYPFLISVDQYKAVVGGRHDVDMSFDYNVSLVESPLPFRASVNISGTTDDIKFKLAKARYPDFYRPQRRKVVESEQVKLRELIRQALIGKPEDQ